METIFSAQNSYIPASCFLSRRADCGSDINKKYFNIDKSNQYSAKMAMNDGSDKPHARFCNLQQCSATGLLELNKTRRRTEHMKQEAAEC